MSASKPRPRSADALLARKLVGLSKLQEDQREKAKRVARAFESPKDPLALLREVIWFHVRMEKAAFGGHLHGRADREFVRLAQRILAILPGTAGRCRVCECHEMGPCPEGCAWTDAKQDLCTACSDALLDR